ncbi:response regulator transcription factor [Microlunatus speluncae]|uniref:response regulator transcription factor n=1 Tax=Microlunatus speluncae TaxID=2594267 RepID=UPI0012662601|nr:response regulator transcription factor [Microlunatus speluncae]
MHRILVVDDDETVREVVRRYLSREGHQVLEAGTGPDALAIFREQRPDLVVLDLMLPGSDGLELCRTMRAESTVGVIMLTALGLESDRVVGLEQGADDYVVKPFSPKELTLRVTRLLQRLEPVILADEPELRLTDGDLIIDTRARTVHRDGEPLNLTGREFDLLAFLIRHAGQAFTRKELLERVWDWSFGDDSTVTVHVRRLREKIEQDPSQPRRLVTVWGRGYRYDREG